MMIYLDDDSAAEIAAGWNVPVEAVREVIAYCQCNPPEIEEDHRKEREFFQEHGVIDAEGNYLRGTLPRRSPEQPSDR